MHSFSSQGPASPKLIITSSCHKSCNFPNFKVNVRAERGKSAPEEDFQTARHFLGYSRALSAFTSEYLASGYHAFFFPHISSSLTLAHLSHSTAAATVSTVTRVVTYPNMAHSRDKSTANGTSLDVRRTSRRYGLLQTFYNSRRNQRQSPLLRLPGEIRNEICILVMTEGRGRVPKPRCRWPEFYGTGLLALTGTCKQLHAETSLLPFALYSLSFECGYEYAKFIARTTLKQRSLITELSLLVDDCEATEGTIDVSWTAVHFERIEGTVDFRRVWSKVGKPLFKKAFPGLQRVVAYYVCEPGEERSDVEHWGADMERRNKGITFDIQFELPGQS